MFVVSPISGWFSDRYQSRWLTAVGLAVSCFGIIGLAEIQLATPYWVLALWLILIGIGSGLFNSLNTSAMMGTVPPQKRGIASGTRSLIMNVGMMFSLAMALAIITSSMSKETMMMIFADEKIKDGSIALNGFVHV